MHFLDIIIICATLLGSLCVGLYMAFLKKERLNTTKRYIIGDNKIKALPIGLSMFSSSVVSFAMIAVPAEIYTFGAQYSVCILALVIDVLLLWYFILPVFCGNLQLESPYEYYKLRFGNPVKNIVLVLYVMVSLLIMPLFLYTSVVALSRISGLSLWFCCVTIGSVCVFYTMIGGFVTVVWTDAGQALIIIICFIAMVIKGTYSVGGVSEIWTRAYEGGRLTLFNMDPDPTVRLTFWSSVIGIGFTNLAGMTHAPFVQRYMTSKNLENAQLSVGVWAAGNFVTRAALTFVGLSIFAYYYNCDPVKNKEVSTPSELVPQYLMNVLGDVPGITGIFIAGFINAGLSTFSCELCAFSGIIYTDIIQNIFKAPRKQSRALWELKILTMILGAFYIILAPFYGDVQYMIQVFASLGSIVFGTQCGILLLGAIFPWANSKGTICGSILAIALSIWMNYGAMKYRYASSFVLPTSVKGCINNNTFLEITNSTQKMLPQSENIFFLYKISFAYYTLINIIVVIFIGMVVSRFTGFTKDLDPKLVSPVMRKYVKPTEDVVLLNS